MIQVLININPYLKVTLRFLSRSLRSLCKTCCSLGRDYKDFCNSVFFLLANAIMYFFRNLSQGQRPRSFCKTVISVAYLVN